MALAVAAASAASLSESDAVGSLLILSNSACASSAATCASSAAACASSISSWDGGTGVLSIVFTKISNTLSLDIADEAALCPVLIVDDTILTVELIFFAAFAFSGSCEVK